MWCVRCFEVPVISSLLMRGWCYSAVFLPAVFECGQNAPSEPSEPSQDNADLDDGDVDSESDDQAEEEKSDSDES